MPGGAASAETPRVDSAPRVIQFAGKRIGVRLEPEFWSALEARAEAEHRRLNELVHTLYDDPRAADNRTAFLRRSALNWIAGELEEARRALSLEATEINAMLELTERPALLLSEDLRAGRTNAAFDEWFLLKTHATPASCAQLRVGFRASLRDLTDRLDREGGRLRGEPAAILVPGRAIPQRVDVVRIGSGHPDAGFIVMLAAD